MKRRWYMELEAVDGCRPAGSTAKLRHILDRQWKALQALAKRPPLVPAQPMRPGADPVGL